MKVLYPGADGVILRDTNGDVLMCVGEGAPADGAVGYSIGCFWWRQSGGTSNWYMNTPPGTRLSAAWQERTVP